MRPDAPDNAVVRSHGALALPLAPLLPLGATYHPAWFAGGGGGGAGASTTTAEVPDLPSLVAVIVALPPATPVTMPDVVTVATPELDVPHVMVRPVSTLPAESLSVALSCAFAPTASVSFFGVTVTEDTGTSVTVIADVPLFPSLVAVMVAEPGATAVTRPDAETVAAAVALDDHVTVCPVSMLPPASRTVAVSCDVLPILSVAEVGEIDTDATAGAVTVTVDESACPSLVA